MFRFVSCLVFSTASLLAGVIDPCACPLPATSTPLPFEQHNPILSRVQWNTVGGYCGETSLISAGLYYGQYASQYTARSLGNKAGSQLIQLLLQTEPSGSESIAAANLLLKTSSSASTSAQDFLTWVKGQVIAGNPVAIGVYMNQTLYETGEAGDDTYDHILLVTGVGSNHSLSNSLTYYDDDVLYFWDNGLWYLNEGDSTVPAYASSPFGTFQQTRTNANAQEGNLYSLPLDVQNYGLSFTGIQANSPLLPISISTAICEMPAILDPSSSGQEPVKPAPSSLTLTLTMNSPSPTNVNVYKYSDATKVPPGNFNQNASQAAKSWLHVSSSTPIVDVIQSDEIAIYRAVQASDPNTEPH